jgi:hypothetical protein
MSTTSVLSGIVSEVGTGFFVLAAGMRVTVSSRVPTEGVVAPGVRVTVIARRRGIEWVAEQVRVEAPRG